MLHDPLPFTGDEVVLIRIGLAAVENDVASGAIRPQDQRRFLWRSGLKARLCGIIGVFPTGRSIAAGRQPGFSAPYSNWLFPS